MAVTGGCGVGWEGGQLPYLPTCPLNRKGADAAEPDEPEFWSRASCLRNKRRWRLSGGGYTPFLVGQFPQYGSQTYRSERVGGRPGPRSQHREQMTAPMFFVVGAEGGHL